MTSPATFFVVLALLFALLPGLARAEDDAAASRAFKERLEEAVAAHDLEAAAGVVDAVIAAKTKRGVKFYVGATDLVLELFPHEIGNTQAAALACLALEVGSAANRDAWANAQVVRRRVLDDADLETGTWFVDKLAGYYDKDKTPVRYRYDLAYLNLDSGRQSEALKILQAIVKDLPEESEARLKVAEILEDQGDVAGALKQYDAVIDGAKDAAPTGNVHVAHWMKARVLRETQRDYDAAENALAAWAEALARSPLDRQRQDYQARHRLETDGLAATREHWGKVNDLKSRTNRLLGYTLAGFVLTLGGGVVFLARKDLI